MSRLLGIIGQLAAGREAGSRQSLARGNNAILQGGLSAANAVGQGGRQAAQIIAERAQQQRAIQAAQQQQAARMLQEQAMQQQQLRQRAAEAEISRALKERELGGLENFRAGTLDLNRNQLESLTNFRNSSLGIQGDQLGLQREQLAQLGDFRDSSLDLQGRAQTERERAAQVLESIQQQGVDIRGREQESTAAARLQQLEIEGQRLGLTREELESSAAWRAAKLQLDRDELGLRQVNSLTDAAVRFGQLGLGRLGLAETSRSNRAREGLAGQTEARLGDESAARVENIRAQTQRIFDTAGLDDERSRAQIDALRGQYEATQADIDKTQAEIVRLQATSPDDLKAIQAKEIELIDARIRLVTSQAAAEDAKANGITGGDPKEAMEQAQARFIMEIRQSNGFEELSPLAREFSESFGLGDFQAVKQGALNGTLIPATGGERDALRARTTPVKSQAADEAIQGVGTLLAANPDNPSPDDLNTLTRLINTRANIAEDVSPEQLAKIDAGLSEFLSQMSEEDAAELRGRMVNTRSVRAGSDTSSAPGLTLREGAFSDTELPFFPEDVDTAAEILAHIERKDVSSGQRRAVSDDLARLATAQQLFPDVPLGALMDLQLRGRGGLAGGQQLQPLASPAVIKLLRDRQIRDLSEIATGELPGGRQGPIDRGSILEALQRSGLSP